MRNCRNCKHLTSRDICHFCGVNGAEIPFPLFMGGPKKCECYERCVKVRSYFSYPKKNDKKEGE